jgi:hypothetical protein
MDNSTEAEILESKLENECQHAGCQCIAKVEGYCSPQCEAADVKGEMELECHCGHGDCGDGFFATEQARATVASSPTT